MSMACQEGKEFACAIRVFPIPTLRPHRHPQPHRARHHRFLHEVLINGLEAASEMRTVPRWLPIATAWCSRETPVLMQSKHTTTETGT